MILHITEARYLDNYRIEVVFNDGKKGVADLSEVLERVLKVRYPEKSRFYQPVLIGNKAVFT